MRLFRRVSKTETQSGTDSQSTTTSCSSKPVDSFNDDFSDSSSAVSIEITSDSLREVYIDAFSAQPSCGGPSEDKLEVSLSQLVPKNSTTDYLQRSASKVKWSLPPGTSSTPPVARAASQRPTFKRSVSLSAPKLNLLQVNSKMSRAPSLTNSKMSRTRSLTSQVNSLVDFRRSSPQILELNQSMSTISRMPLCSPSLAEQAIEDFQRLGSEEKLDDDMKAMLKEMAEDEKKETTRGGMKNTSQNDLDDTSLNDLDDTSQNDTRNEITQLKLSDENPELSTIESEIVPQVSPVHQLQLSPEELNLLGISVHYLSNHFMNEVGDAGFDETATMNQIEDLEKNDEKGVVRQKGSRIECPIDGKIGAAYVHSVANLEDVGPANIMLSYARSSSIGDIVNTLVEHCTSEGLDPKKTYAFIWCLCSNQHRLVEEKSCAEKISFDDFRSVIQGRLTNIGHLLVVMSPWQAPSFLRRIWCLFELYMAKQLGCNITIRMPSREWNKFMDCLRGVNEAEQVCGLFKAVHKLNVRTAYSNSKSDRINIMRHIRTDIEYDDFNSNVSEHVKKWALNVVEVEMDKLSREGAKENYGILLNVVSELYYAIQEVDKSLNLGKLALSRNESLFGRWHKATAKSLFLVGVALYWKFEFDASIILQKESLAIRERVLGRESGDTAESIVWMAKILKDMGEEEEALNMHNEALAIRTAVFGRDHAKTLESLNHIACIVKEKDDLDETMKSYEEIAAISLKVYGREHIDTGKAILNIALVFRRKEEKREALQKFEEACMIFEKVLGIEHDYSAYARDEIISISKELAEIYLRMVETGSDDGNKIRHTTR